MRNYKNLILLIFISSNTYALDLEKYRSRMNNILGEKITSKIIGVEKKESKYKVPKIPELKYSATDASVYSKEGKIFKQGSKFNNLDLEKKRTFRISFIRELFSAVRQTEVKGEELATYLNILEQGGSREGVYRRIINDDVYRSLEDFPAPPKDKFIAFINNFGPKYLATGYSEEGMKKVNIYTIKKIITEKALEVLDALTKNPEDIYHWYTVFSEDMALNYSSSFTGKVRTQKSPDFHYKWSQQVPFQHIKSEVIVKLNLVLNKLNE